MSLFNINATVTVHVVDAEANSKLDELLTLARQIMATLTDLQTQVSNQTTVVQSAITLLTGLAAKVAELTPNQAAIDQLAADITAQTQALADAIVTNTPAQP